MRKEELYETVKNLWNDKINLPALARTYSAHHQIVCETLDSKGGNDCLRERKGLIFEVRNLFTTTENRRGVMSVLDPPNEKESIQHQLLAEHNSREL